MRHFTATLVSTLALVMVTPAGDLAAQASTSTQRARRHFISVSYDWTYTQPLHFGDHPLGDLVGAEVAAAQREAFDYHTRDGRVLIDVLEFRRRARGAGVTIYPFGSSRGATLAIRGSYEELPVIRLDFEGPGAPPDYALAGARAYDIAAGVDVADRSPGWGLGSHAFVLAGIGRIRSDLGDGERFFAEGGGGLTSGPLGVELSVKFAWNDLAAPVQHRFLTVPVALRGTVTF